MYIGVNPRLTNRECRLMEIIQKLIDFIMGIIDSIKSFVADIRAKNDGKSDEEAA